MIARAILGVALSLVLLYGLALASAAPLPWHDENDAEVRLSWSARPERIETCRALTPEEMAARPEHMRQTMSCEGRFAAYDLELMVDGRAQARAVVRGGGLRNDRPIYLLKSVPVEPGTRHVRVTFTRRDEGDTTAAPEAAGTPATELAGDRAQREVDARRRVAGAALPPALVLDTVVHIEPRAVFLVTYDPILRRLR